MRLTKKESKLSKKDCIKKARHWKQTAAEQSEKARQWEQKAAEQCEQARHWLHTASEQGERARYWEQKYNELKHKLNDFGEESEEE